MSSSTINPYGIFLLRFDGGCNPTNPGPAAGGCVLYQNGKIIRKVGTFIGSATNNQAEYTGLINGLELCVSLGIKRIKVEGDSMLVIKQMKGEYNCSSENLKELYTKAQLLIRKFEKIDFNHIYRDKNSESDEICNQCIDNKSNLEYPKVHQITNTNGLTIRFID
jgi:ribonuclease HI